MRSHFLAGSPHPHPPPPPPLWELGLQKPSEPSQSIDSSAVVIKQALPGRGGGFSEALEPGMGTILAGVCGPPPQKQPSVLRQDNWNELCTLILVKLPWHQK